MRRCLAWLMPIYLTSCMHTGPTECAWARKILVNQEDLITRGTAEQIVAHNRKVDAFCRSRDAFNPPVTSENGAGGRRAS